MRSPRSKITQVRDFEHESALYSTGKGWIEIQGIEFDSYKVEEDTPNEKTFVDIRFISRKREVVLKPTLIAISAKDMDRIAKKWLNYRMAEDKTVILDLLEEHGLLLAPQAP